MKIEMELPRRYKIIKLKIKMELPQEDTKYERWKLRWNCHKKIQNKKDEDWNGTATRRYKIRKMKIEMEMPQEDTK